MFAEKYMHQQKLAQGELFPDLPVRPKKLRARRRKTANPKTKEIGQYMPDIPKAEAGKKGLEGTKIKTPQALAKVSHR
jgi:hypothetical protein